MFSCMRATTARHSFAVAFEAPVGEPGDHPIAHSEAGRRDRRNNRIDRILISYVCLPGEYLASEALDRRFSLGQVFFSGKRIA